jgi:hypothetical protein
MSVRNIMKVYNQATGCERLNGASWYREAQGSALDISTRLKLPLHIVTGVIAALSPNNKWDRNGRYERPVHYATEMADTAISYI